MSIYLSICLSAICKLENEAILRDFFNFRTWQRQKRNNSARLPQFLNSTTSKTKQVCEASSIFGLDNVKNETLLRGFLNFWTSNTKQFCETSSTFKVDNIKNETIPRDSFTNGRLSAEPTASYQCVSRFFHSTCLKYCACHGKSDARSYEVLHLSRKIIFPKLKIRCSKMQPLSGNQRSDLLTSLMNMSLVLRLPRDMHLSRSSSNVPRLPSFLEMLQNPHVLLTFDKVHNPLHLPRETTSDRPKVVRTCCVFNIMTSKRASRHNGVHFFDMSTSNSGPVLVYFVHFDLEFCFTPQLRALFRHLNFQKWSEHGVFCAFWRRNVGTWTLCHC